MIIPLVALLLQQPALAPPESLLAARNLPAARRAAEQAVRARPRDPAARLLLGRVWYAWPTIGRYNALAQFDTAARLAPRDPEPLYWKMKVGLRLGSDDGEVLARESLLRLFALDPDYRDAWEVFAQLYHDAGIWRRADAALATQPQAPSALAHRAAIALALEQAGRADSLAALVLQRRSPDIAAYLIRAQAAFLEHRDARGEAWYDSALAVAALDSGDVLWEQVWMIAAPAEIARHDSLDPADRRAFFETFWSRRDPDLVTPRNERLAEHYRRLAEVRRLFRLLHPLTAFHHSAAARALAASYARDAAVDLARSDSGFDGLPPSEVLYPDLLAVNDTAGRQTVYAHAGLNAEGLVWIRHGRPDSWERAGEDSFAPVLWTYYTAAGPLTITFAGIPGPLGPHGDYIVAPPRSRREARQARALLSSDETSIPAMLAAHGWSAFFRGADSTRTELYLRAVPETAAAVLWEERGPVIGRATGPGLLRLTAPPGAYALGLDVDSAGALGRLREVVRLPAFSGAALALSSLVLAPGDSVPGREAVLAAMPADLTYPAGRPLAAYAEIYGLTADAQGRARYTVTYRFAPRHGRPVEFAFSRDAPAAGVTPEQLVLEPGRVPPGRYRVTLAVTDIATAVKSQTVALDITIR